MLGSGGSVGRAKSWTRYVCEYQGTRSILKIRKLVMLLLVMGYLASTFQQVCSILMQVMKDDEGASKK